MTWQLLQDSIFQFFVYHPEQPLIFTSAVFWIFFGGVLLVDSFLHTRRAWRHSFLFLASVFFYYKTSGFFFSLLVFTACWDFLVAKRIYLSRKKNWRKFWLTVSIVMNLAVLCYFKYAYFFTDIFTSVTGVQVHVIDWLSQFTNHVCGTQFSIDQILLPIGISFFTFQSISYTVEVYRGELKPVKRFADFAFFVTFFPQLVAGPIVRSTDFIPQLYKEYSLTRHEWGLAVFWILNGLIKKVLLADYIAVNFVDRIFAQPEIYSGFENLMAVFAYSLQVYADFSGYTDMAIGIALLMGFHLTKNFNAPYKAVNVSDFWRRWHMSLSNWLRYYLYIPLGGSRKASLGTFIILGLAIAMFTSMSGSWFFLMCGAIVLSLSLILAQFVPSFSKWTIANLNLMITMLIGGLWHGASWNFIIWGAMNGLAIVVYKLWSRISPWENKNTWYKRAWGILLTFTFISFTRIWFRSGSSASWSDLKEIHNVSDELFSANAMLSKIFLEMNWAVAPNVLWSYALVFIIFVFGMIVHWLPSYVKETYRTRFAALPIPVIAFIALVSVFFCYQVISSDMHPFIYFQF